MNIILKSVLIINLLFSVQNFNLIEREDCRMLDQDSCEQSEFCMWVMENNNLEGEGFCTESENSPSIPECLNNCEYLDYLLFPESSDQFCDAVISILNTGCTEGCEEEFLFEFENLSQNCEECLSSENLNCDDLLYSDGEEEEFEDDCRYFESQDECLAVGCSWSDEDGCYSNFDEEDNDGEEEEFEDDCRYFESQDECLAVGCSWSDEDGCYSNFDEEDNDGEEDTDNCDESLMCAPVLTCIENLLYPTSCGPNNCDEPIDHCNNENIATGIVKLASGGASPGNDFVMDVGYISNVPIGGVQFNLIDNPNWLNGIEFMSDNDCFESNFNEIDGGLIAIMFSLDGCTLDPTDEFIRFGRLHWRLSEEAVMGETVSVSIENLIVSDQEGNELLFESVNSEILVAGQLGDINNDAAVNVIDIVALINFILQIENPNYLQFGLADFNQDNELNVLDVVAIVNYILNNNNLVKNFISDRTAAYLTENNLKLTGQIGGIQFKGELISEVKGSDVLVKSEDIGIIYNLNGSLNTTELKFASEPLNIIISDINGDQVRIKNIADFKLNEAYPNPFNPITNISYSLPENDIITINIYDIKGNHIQTVIDGYQKMGDYNFLWNAQNQSSGLYFVKMKTKLFTQTQKLMLVK